ncbi:MAG: hypothetical protein OZ921_03720 [Sorangiineae bacterium]|nr:hypothetical protein [Polyangiaceae bacterium]MEB2321598.1 hypothetical protein [Sorangiineae bacterium]
MKLQSLFSSVASPAAVHAARGWSEADEGSDASLGSTSGSTGGDP